VQRDTVWTYLPGTKVYQLTAPNGDVYTMQSYSQIKDKSLTISDLDGLAGKLSLPQGWKYGVHTISQELQLKATAPRTSSTTTCTTPTSSATPRPPRSRSPGTTKENTPVSVAASR
jgi:hypothetical protein